MVPSNFARRVDAVILVHKIPLAILLDGRFCRDEVSSYTTSPLGDVV